MFFFKIVQMQYVIKQQISHNNVYLGLLNVLL